MPAVTSARLPTKQHTNDQGGIRAPTLKIVQQPTVGRVRIMSNIDVDRRITRHLTSNSLCAFLVAKRATTMRKMAWKVRAPIKARCEICNGAFGLIRHRFASKQFCSKQCLERYLTDREQEPSRITESDKH